LEGNSIGTDKAQERHIERDNGIMAMLMLGQRVEET
jgi:hypothetical protein